MTSSLNAFLINVLNPLTKRSHYHNLFICISLYLICIVSYVPMLSSSEIVYPYDQSILPEILPSYHTPNDTYKKHIPRIIWMAVKDEKYIATKYIYLIIMIIQEYIYISAYTI